MIVSIAGNIGSGKSALTSLLHEEKGWKPVFESADENPYIRDFYGHMGKWAFHSQVFFLSRRCQLASEPVRKREVVLHDRSVYEDGEIFATVLHELGYMSDRDCETYNHLYQSAMRILEPPDLIVYLEEDLGTLMHNIRTRARSYEQHVDESYIAALNAKYDAWFQQFDRCPVVKITSNVPDAIGVSQKREELLYLITNEIRKYS